MNVHKANKNKLLILCIVSGLSLSACAKFKSGLPDFIANPQGKLEARALQGESQNSFQTKIIDARASWMLGEDRNGTKYSLVVIGQQGRSESSAPDLNYNRAYLGGIVSNEHWWISATGSDERYRVEIGTKYNIAPGLLATASTTHKNKHAGGEKQTTQKAELCWRMAKGLCWIMGYQVRNHGDGANSVEDEIVAGVSYEF